jgi:hypothetical protein
MSIIGFYKRGFSFSVYSPHHLPFSIFIFDIDFGIDFLYPQMARSTIDTIDIFRLRTIPDVRCPRQS